VDDIASLMGALREGSCPDLQSLNLSENWLDGSDGPSSITDAMRHGAFTHLTELQMNRCSLEPEGMVGFFDAMTLPQLSFLSLMDNHLGVTGVAAFCGAVRRGAAPGLKALCLTHVGMTSHGASQLAGVFAKLRDLKYCEISMNPIGDEGFVALVKAWRGSTANNNDGEGIVAQYMTQLRCAECDISTRGLQALAFACSQQPSFLPKLEVLALGGNAGSDVAYGTLLRALLNPGRPLQSINLVGGCVGDAAMSILGNGIMNRGGGKGLRELKLAGNRITSEGTSRLINVLRGGGLPDLRLLDLVSNPVMHDPETLRELSAVLETGPSRLYPGMVVCEDTSRPRACFFTCSIQ